jgi:hypothetical protein
MTQFSAGKGLSLCHHTQNGPGAHRVTHTMYDSPLGDNVAGAQR